MRPFLHTALRLAAVSVLILWPSRVRGQSQLPRWQAGVAKVSVDAKLGRTPGTAVVVSVSGQTAILVTCAHVVVEESSPRVEFRAAPLREFRATVRAREPVQALPLAATVNTIGYPMSAYCEIERHGQGRLIQHLQRRSQRPYRPPEGESWLRHLGRLGLIRLSELVHA